MTPNRIVKHVRERAKRMKNWDWGDFGSNAISVTAGSPQSAYLKMLMEMQTLCVQNASKFNRVLINELLCVFILLESRGCLYVPLLSTL